MVDHFHLVRGANTALDSVRRERQREPAGAARRAPAAAARGATWRQDLYRARHRLLKARERLSERERRRLCELFEREPADRRGLGRSRRHSASIYRAPDRARGRAPAGALPAAVERAQLPAFTAFADGVRLWRTELLAYFDEPTTNGYAEGVINKVKVIKRRAYGIPTFDGFRDRVLLACA